MTISSSIVTVALTATLVVNTIKANSDDPIPVVLRNDSGSDIFLGGSDVTTANGLKLPTASALALDLGPGDDLYAISVAGGLALQVLRQRVTATQVV